MDFFNVELAKSYMDNVVDKGFEQNINTNRIKVCFEQLGGNNLEYSIVNLQNAFDSDGFENNKGTITNLCKMAFENNINKNLPLTVLRITDHNDLKDVNRERLYFAFNKGTQKLMKVVRDYLGIMIKSKFPNINVSITHNYIDFFGNGVKLSKEMIGSILDTFLKSMNFYDKK
jgi:hypothetical protein